MEDVIGEISKIDKQAFERENQNKIVLAEEKTRYENEIATYREEKLKTARLHADMIYEKLAEESDIETSERTAESDKNIKELKEEFSKTKNISSMKFLKRFFP